MPTTYVDPVKSRLESPVISRFAAICGGALAAAMFFAPASMAAGEADYIVLYK